MSRPRTLTFLALFCLSSWGGWPRPSQTATGLGHDARTPAVTDVVFCLDVTKPSRNWDAAGARGAAVWFADALLGSDARRSVLVFSYRSRDLAPPGPTPLWRRPLEPNPENSLEYALDQPAAGGPANPVWPLRRALEILEGQSGQNQAIFLILGHRVQIGPTDSLTPRVADLAGEIIGRCRLQGIRLFVIHREDQPGMDRLWAELAGATGGAARYARTHDAMARVAVEWAASLAGYQAVTLGDDGLLAPPTPDRQYAVLFLSEGETPDSVMKAMESARFGVSNPDDIILRGRFGLARVVAGDGAARLPFGPERILQVAGGLDRPITPIVAPSLVTRSADQSPVVIRLLGESDGEPEARQAPVVSTGIGLLRPASSSEARPVAVALALGIDPTSRATACQATFDAPLPLGPGLISLGDDPRQGPAEFYQSDLYVYPDLLTVRPMLIRAGGDDNALLARVALPEGEWADARVFLSAQENDGPVALYKESETGRTGEIRIAADYAIGERYRIAAGALAFHPDDGPRFIPAPVSEFPPRSYLLPDSPGPGETAMGAASPSSDALDAELADPTVLRQGAKASVESTPPTAMPAATPAPALPALSPLPLHNETPLEWFALSPEARARSLFILANLAILAGVILLFGLGRKVGLFLRREDCELRVPQGEDGNGDTDRDTDGDETWGENEANGEADWDEDSEDDKADWDEGDHTDNDETWGEDEDGEGDDMGWDEDEEEAEWDEEVEEDAAVWDEDDEGDWNEDDGWQDPDRDNRS